MEKKKDWKRIHLLMYAIESSKQMKPRRMFSPRLISHTIQKNEIQKNEIEEKEEKEEKKEKAEKKEEEKEIKTLNNVPIHVIQLDLIGEMPISFNHPMSGRYNHMKHGDDRWMSIESKEWTIAERYLPQTLQYQVERLIKTKTYVEIIRTEKDTTPLTIGGSGGWTIQQLHTSNEPEKKNKQEDEQTNKQENEQKNERKNQKLDISTTTTSTSTTTKTRVSIHLPHLTDETTSSKQYFRSRCYNKNGWSEWSGTTMIDMYEFTRLKDATDTNIHSVLTKDRYKSDFSRNLSKKYSKNVVSSISSNASSSVHSDKSGLLPSIHAAALSGALRLVELNVARDFTCINLLHNGTFVT